jgi:hypothetical protein
MNEISSITLASRPSSNMVGQTTEISHTVERRWPVPVIARLLSQFGIHLRTTRTVMISHQITAVDPSTMSATFSPPLHSSQSRATR